MGEILVSNEYGISQYEIDICDHRVNELLRLRRILGRSLDMESLHDQIVESHWSYRSEVNHWRMRSVSNAAYSFITNHEARSALNRLSFNVLNLGKLFLDKHFHKTDNICFAADLTGNPEHKLLIEQDREEAYTSNAEYVIGCKLRGASQHHKLPVEIISYGTRYEPQSNTTSVKLGIYYSNKELLDKNVPTKMIDGTVEFDLTDILDGYVFALSKMQELNRKLTKNFIHETRMELLTQYNSIRQEVDEEYECHIRFSEHECMPVNLDWFEVHDYLTKKHNMPVKHSSIKY